MIVRPAKKEDYQTLVELHRDHSFPFPDFDNILDILVAADNGKIVAWGYTKKYVEVVFVPDKKSPDITKVKALKLLTEMSSNLTIARGIDQIHSYVEDEKFAQLLVERFNYGVCTGIPLFLNLEKNNGKE